MHHGADPAGADVGENLAAGDDFLVFPVVGQGERHPDGVADAVADQLLEGDARLFDSHGRHARLGHTHM